MDADLVASAERIDVAVAAMDERAWDGQSRNTAGSLQRSRDLVAPRWREIEVHHVDLGLGYEPDEWPAEFVERLLPAALADVGRRLPGLDRIDPATVLAWTFGRVDPPAGLPRLLPY